jgi:Sulfatase
MLGWISRHFAIVLLIGAIFGLSFACAARAEDKKPNIVVIMGDDIGMWNIGAYHRGMMAGRTPNLDRLAAEGMLFTDYYAEASYRGGQERNRQVGRLRASTD